MSNFAPIFEAGPPPTEIVEIDTESSYIYQVPASLDIEGDAITIVLSDLEPWMQYDEVNQTISLLELDESKVGSYSIKIILMDNKGEQNQYEIKF